MVKAGNEIIACAPSASESIKLQLSEWGIQYIDIFIDRKGINPIKDYKSAIKIYSLINKINPDLILSYTIKPVIYGSICGWLARIPKIASIITGLGYAFISNSPKIIILRLLILILYKFALSKNQIIFFQNPDDFNLFRNLSIVSRKAKALVINGSGVDTEHFQSTKQPDKNSFLLIARLIREKGVAEYVSAARIIKMDYPDAVFRIVGWIDDGPGAIKKKELESWIEEGTIDFIGNVQDVRPYIDASSVYVLPSYREGTPRTVLEAMSMGRPIITTDAPGCRETVTHGRNGFLVPVKYVEGIANAMEKFIQNPDLIKKMGKESRQIAIQKYDVHKINRSILSALEL
jgi:glycosyltransferase involved in cell wall biosynthesis